MHAPIHLRAVLDATTVRQIHGLLQDARWIDGATSAGSQAAQAKNNEQLHHGCAPARSARALILAALDAHAPFFAAALPRRVVPPEFNRYGGQRNAYGEHVDNAVRYAIDTGQKVRTDLSATLFLSAPEDYDGGELCIGESGDPAGEPARYKLPAGDMLLYPGTSVHQVLPVTRGTRVASFFWVESMVRLAEHRRLLLDLDRSIQNLRNRHGDDAETVRLTGTYHNLLRLWADC